MCTHCASTGQIRRELAEGMLDEFDITVICDRDAAYKMFEEEHPDIVVNFAAESYVDRSIEDHGIFLQTNIMGTATLMDASRKYGIERYHQVLTEDIFGDLPLVRPDFFFTESTPIHTSDDCHALNNKAMPAYGEGLNVRDWLYDGRR